MAFICPDPKKFDGQVVGDGECVAFARACSGAPPTASWKQGVKVRGGQVAIGAVIATFTNGKYTSISGTSHAAIYVGQTDKTIGVWDQWKGHAVSLRALRFKGGAGSPVNDGDQFYVVEA